MMRRVHDMPDVGWRSFALTLSIIILLLIAVVLAGITK
jgi:hypothetical protein